MSLPWLPISGRFLPATAARRLRVALDRRSGNRNGHRSRLRGRWVDREPNMTEKDGADERQDEDGHA